MCRVAGLAAQARVNTDRRPVVAREHLSLGARSMTLVAQRLSPIRAQLHPPVTVPHGRQREPLHADVLERPPVVEGERGPDRLLVATGHGLALAVRWQRLALAVEGVAGEARHRWQRRVRRFDESPWALAIERGDEVADAALEVHGVAAQAIVHQLLVRVVLGIHENGRVGRPVRSAGPLRVLLTVTGGAALYER